MCSTTLLVSATWNWIRLPGLLLGRAARLASVRTWAAFVTSTYASNTIQRIVLQRPIDLGRSSDSSQLGFSRSRPC
ncbi:hypothetical protein B0H15DRAFT_411621 [Mycena belliarum]|uniref:Secreted protein n=1 Tax=Mycena belliarum TaxID=1033014 RepID=A0AAD6UFA5_9AGAR|nr:hypothetical protein B0H15DRAFT_411621 [Mycena belliae]